MTGARVVIIGASHAAIAAATKLRSLSGDANITIVSAEKDFPYQRPPLSKAYLAGKSTFENILLRPENWYEENRIALRRAVTATGIDRPENVVRLSDGSRLSYDRLIVATGAIARRLPAEVGGYLPNVYVMRDLADANALKCEMRAGQRLAVIGGGYIGLEAASEASKKGVRVTVLEAADRILKRVAAKETADDIRALHLSHGVDIREGVQLRRIVEVNGMAAGVELDGKTILPADFVLTGIGVSPNTALAEQADLEIDNGIATDAHLRTSDPAIFAAGDCASFPWKGQRVRLESVQNATDQGIAIAANIAGDERAYDAVPWFWSDQFDLKLQIAGLNIGYDNVVTRQGANPACRAHFYFKGDEFLSVDCLNDPLTFALSRKILETGRPLSREQAEDPQFSLKSAVSLPL